MVVSPDLFLEGSRDSTSEFDALRPLERRTEQDIGRSRAKLDRVMVEPSEV